MTIFTLQNSERPFKGILKSKTLLILLFLITSHTLLISQTILTNDTFESGDSTWSLEDENATILDVSEITNLLGSASYSCSNTLDANIIKLISEGSTTSATYNFSNYNSIIIEYDYFVEGLNTDENWYVELSSDNGDTWSILKEYINGIDFENGNCGPNGFGYKETVTLSSNNFIFNNNNKLRLRIDANESEDYLFIDNIKISGNTAQKNTWLGYNFNSINDHTLWSLGVIPGADDEIIIPESKELNISESIVFFDITVFGHLNITKSGALTVNNDFINLGSVVMTSDAYENSSLIVNGTATGNIHYDKWVNNFEYDLNDMDIIATPVSGETVAHFLGNNSTSILNNGTFYAVNTYNNGGFGWGDSLLITSTSDLLSDIGYAIATPPNNSQTVRFTGDIETESTNVTLHKVQSAWNVVGNPYASYLNVSDFLQTNAEAIDNEYLALITYNNNTATNQETYEYYNLSSAMVDNMNIAPGQGFYIAAKNDNAIINFTPNMRTVLNGNDISENQTYSNESISHKLRLNITKSNAVRHTQFYFFDDDNISEGFDNGYDTNIFDQYDNFNIYSTLLANSIDEKLAIQTLPLTNVEESIIPLGIEAQAGDQITFSIDNLDIPVDTVVWLEDRDTGNWNELTSNSHILNISETLSGFGRFYIHFENNASLSNTEFDLNDIGIKSVYGTNQLLITGELLEATIVNIYDVNGRLILQTTADAYTVTNRINVSNFKTGIYIVELENTSQTISQQVLIK